MNALSWRRRCFAIGNRSVHARLAGEGPPVVLVHGSPASSEILEHEMGILAPHYSCYAFDTPGFGDSAPLASLADGVGSLADALGETLETLGLINVVVFGTHSGAAIALELAHRHARLVRGLVLDGLPLFEAGEEGDVTERYFETLQVDDLGGHFAHVWTRFRDLFQWFPWTNKIPSNLNEVDLPPPARLQRWVSMFYRAATSYAAPYKAVFAYGSQARRAVAELTTPAVFMAHDGDMLFSHLDRLPPLRQWQRIARGTRANMPALLLAAVREMAAGPVSPASSPMQLQEMPRLAAVAQSAVKRQFHDLPHGQMFVRRHGVGPIRWLLLHDAPGGSRQLEALLAALPANCAAIAPDLPGCAESDPLPASNADVAGVVQALALLLALEGATRLAVYGSGFGAAIALVLARRRPDLVSSLVLHAPPAPDPVLRDEMRAQFTPAIEVAADGSHWYRTWLMLRDSLLYCPWYRGQCDSLRRVTEDFAAQRLHDWTFDVMQQAAHYHQIPQAVLRMDVADELQQLAASAAMPIRVLRDPQQRLDLISLRNVPAGVELMTGPWGAAQLAALLTQQTAAGC